MPNINGDHNIVISGDGNTIIKEVLMKEKEISNASSIINIVMETIRTNHEILNGKNPNSIYLAGFTEDHLNNLADNVLSGLHCNQKPNHYIDMTDQTKTYFYESLFGYKASRDDWGKLFDDCLYNTNQVLVIKGLSKSKYRGVQFLYRELIKALDDAHIYGIHPKTDIVFIDYPSFLQKHYDYIGPYLTTNLIGV